MRLQQKVALITGAANGIGRATAARFAREGASVVLADLDEACLAETAAAISAAGGRAFPVTGNVTRRADVQRMVDTAVEQYGRLDILINNAGITRDALTCRVKDGDVKLMSDDQWDAVLDVNLKGTWLCSQLAALVMIEQAIEHRATEINPDKEKSSAQPRESAFYSAGRIVNTASVGALGHIGQANYAASKAGVIGLTSTLALEWARFGIAVNCIAPGAVRTRMTAAIPEKIMPGLLQKIPYRRLAEPEEIAAVHLFLASDENTFMTGQVLFVDGGQTTGA